MCTFKSILPCLVASTALVNCAPAEVNQPDMVFIIVDAKPRGEPSLDESAHPPGIFTVLNAAATNPMENYSTDTVEMARLFINRWNLEQRGAPGQGPQVAFYAIHVRFELEQDESVRGDLQSIPTRLQLPSAQVDLLVEKGLLKTQVLREGKVVFDHCVKPHHHFIDEETGAILDIPWDALQVTGKDCLKDFEVNEYQVVVRGRRKT